MFFYQKIKNVFWIFILSFFILFFLLNCTKKTSSDESFEIFLKRSSRELCEKIISCNSNVIRTFPKNLQKEVTVEVCQDTLLVDLEEKVKLHTDSMKLLTKSCYEKILEANCTQYLALAYGDLSCYSLKKESDMVYAKAREKKVNLSNTKIK